VTRVRAGGVAQPVTHQATWPEWCDEEFPGEIFPLCRPWTAISSIVDYISQTTYSWWESRVKVSWWQARGRQSTTTRAFRVTAVVCSCHPMSQIRFGCIPPEDAASFHLERQLKVQSTYPDQLVVMSEVGYPGPPETYNDAPDGAPCQSANKQIQLTVMDQTLTAVSVGARALARPCSGVAAHHGHTTRWHATTVSHQWSGLHPVLWRKRAVEGRHRRGE